MIWPSPRTRGACRPPAGHRRAHPSTTRRSRRSHSRGGVVRRSHRYVRIRAPRRCRERARHGCRPYRHFAPRMHRHGQGLPVSLAQIRAARFRAQHYSHLPLAAPVTAMMTPACWAGVRLAHGVLKFPGPVKWASWTIFRYGSTSVFGSACWLSIHTLAAWQAWPYCDSVASAGTSTLVVTPPGETPMAPGWAGSAGRGGSSLVGAVGVVGVDGFCSVDEQPATVSVSSAQNSATRWAYLRMPTNLCNAAAPSRGCAAGAAVAARGCEIVPLTVNLGQAAPDRTLSWLVDERPRHMIGVR